MKVWRVLADPAPKGLDAAGFIEVWHEYEAAAFLHARALEEAGHGGVEVNAWAVKKKASVIDALNRRVFVGPAVVVPPEKWRSAGKARP